MAKPNILIRSKKSKANDLFNNNQLREADELLAAICQSAPTDIESWIMRGVIHRKLGLLKESVQFCRHALGINPDHAWAHHALGVALYGQGVTEQAKNHFRRAIQLRPDYADAHYALGNVLREEGDIRGASEAYRRALGFQPNFVEAMSNLGALLTVLGEFKEAALILNKANALRPNTPQILCNQGHILQHQDRQAEALDKYQRALCLSPNSIDALTNVAILLEKSNRIEEAKTLVDRELPRYPSEPSLLIVAAKLARRNKQFKDAISFLERALKQNLSIETAGEAHIQLGQMYDREGNTESAYRHLAEGNRLVALYNNEINHGRPVFLDRVRRLHGYLTEELAGAIQHAAPMEPSPIFLLGFPRSGTTLLEQILDSHPSLQGMEERPTVYTMVQAFEKMANGNLNALAELTPEHINQLRKIYFEEVAKHITLRPGSLLIDKMPLNTVNVHIIWRVFPNAKFILAIRHPCDACFSCFMQNFKLNEAMASFFTLESSAEIYRTTMQIWLDAISRLPINYHRIRYEDLVANFEHETRALLSFLEVDWNEKVLGFNEHASKKGQIRTVSYHQVTQPIYQHATYRWKRYSAYFGETLPVLQPYIDYFGYGD